MQKPQDRPQYTCLMPKDLNLSLSKEECDQRAVTKQRCSSKMFAAKKLEMVLT